MPSCRSQSPAVRRRDNWHGSYSGPSAGSLWLMVFPSESAGLMSRVVAATAPHPSPPERPAVGGRAINGTSRTRSSSLVPPTQCARLDVRGCSGYAAHGNLRATAPPSAHRSSTPSFRATVPRIAQSSPSRRPYRSILPPHSRSDGFSVCFVSSLPSPAHSWLLPSRLQRLRPPPPASNSPSLPLRPRSPQHAPASTSPTWTARSVRKTISIGS